MVDKLEEILEYLKKNFNQDSEDYNIFFGSKPQVLRYDEHTAISFWSCGAIACIGSVLYFFSEDDGYWWISEKPCFSIGWVDSYIDALNRLKEYVDKNGTPIYFSGTDVVCNYSL